jgi:hypothetical protein
MMSNSYACVLGNGRYRKHYPDVVGICLHFLTISMFCVMLLMISLVFLGVDPLFLLLDTFSLNPTPGGFSSFVVFTLRFATLTTLAYAIGRSISFVMVWVILVLKVSLNCIDLSGQSITKTWMRSNSYANFQKGLNLYQSLSLMIFVYFGVFSSPFAVAIMSFGLGMEIASVFIIIRLQSQMLWPIYVGIGILAVNIPLLADAELPEAIRVFENTEEILRNWKLQMTFGVRGDRRYYSKKIASLRPCSMYAGLGDVMFFPLRKSTKVTYYGLMVNYVVNALISVPESFTLSVHY